MTGATWQEEVMSRFAARESPTLSIRTMPRFASVASSLMPEPAASDGDLALFVQCVVAYVEEATEDVELAARVAGAAGFVFATGRPNRADRELIAAGNGKNFNGDFDSKMARDTWAYMSYKRALGDTRRDQFTYKPGAEHRQPFAQALVDAVERAASAPSAFRNVAERRIRGKLDATSIDYQDKHDGTASRPGRRDRSTATDVNYPDGSLVGIGERFTKTWAVTNVGDVPWYARRLTRVTPQGPTFPSSPDWIPIPDTLPGHTVRLSVPFVASRVQGFSEVRFKMTDEHGRLYFPAKYPHGLTLIVETGHVHRIERAPE